MEHQERPAAPESGDHEFPTIEALMADPEVARLLDFEPVPRQRDVEGGWTVELQREFIARLALLGSAQRACEEMGKNRTGMTKLYRSPLAASFREAWHAAVEVAKRRKAAAAALQHVAPGTMPPGIDLRIKGRGKLLAGTAGPLPGQVMNEHGQWEDEASVARRGDDAKDSIRNKLLRCRRLYLKEISGSPGKRAAFEILTELPIDWDKAKRGEPQADEPYARINQHQPDMVLTAESGWSFGEIGYGPDKKAAAQAQIDAWRRKKGLETVQRESETAEDKPIGAGGGTSA